MDVHNLNWKLAQTLFNCNDWTTMVEIQCPHCEEDVELEDGASGLFDCPHCDEVFSWGSDTVR